MKRLPKNYKYSRVHRGDYAGVPVDYKLKSSLPTHYTAAYIAKENGKLTYKQMDSLLKTLKKHLKKKTAIKINVAFNQPYTGKSLAVRMGKGKGAQKGWLAFVKKGQVILEIESKGQKDYLDIKMSEKEVSEKLPIKINLSFVKY